MTQTGKEKRAFFALCSLLLLLCSLSPSSFLFCRRDEPRENILPNWNERQVFEDFLASRRVAILREYVEFLSVPNVSSDSQNLRRNALFIQAMLERRRVKVRLLEDATSPPLVYVELLVPGASKTLLFYAHYDGQPINPSGWTSPPWKPVLRHGPLVILLASMRNSKGRIHIENFNDDAVPLTPEERKAIAEAPQIDSFLRQELELAWSEDQ